MLEDFVAGFLFGVIMFLLFGIGLLVGHFSNRLLSLGKRLMDRREICQRLDLARIESSAIDPHILYRTGERGAVAPSS